MRLIVYSILLLGLGVILFGMSANATPFSDRYVWAKGRCAVVYDTLRAQGFKYKGPSLDLNTTNPEVPQKLQLWENDTGREGAVVWRQRGTCRVLDQGTVDVW